MSEIQINMLNSYTKIESKEITIYINNTDIKEMTIKKEDNGKPIILV